MYVFAGAMINDDTTLMLAVLIANKFIINIIFSHNCNTNCLLSSFCCVIG